MDHSDIKLVEKLRREYPEQFYTLVRMHLSFILDLNTDESEVAHEKNKFKPSKWVSVAFSRKAKCPSKGVMEGAPLTQEGICQVYQLIEFLGKEQNIIQEGIFRRSGKMTRQNELKMLMNQGVPLKLGEGNFSVHDCASVLKNFLAELPEPLLTDAHFPAYYQISDLCKEVASGRGNEKRLLRALQLLLLLLPVENRLLLRDLLQLLHKTACHEAKNKMSADNLATLFTPHLICPRKLTPEALHDNSQKMCGVIAFMIKQEKNLFNIPPKLATDVRAFWIEHNKSRITPKVCRVSTDGLTASTVFSFVDRERSAEVHKQVGDPTEVALAQLYAHIQTLPESQQKRRLVKQFNRENGHGTPLRFKPHGRSRSLGDSIKRHIFKGGTKMDKCEDSLGRRCSVVRSLSQEDISETMMTPRSRKPVVVLSGSNLCHLTSINNMDTPDDANRMPSPIGGSRAIKAFVNGDCVGTEIHTPIKPAGAFCTISDCDKENSFSRKIVLENENSIFNMYTDGHEADSCNGGSLSSPFKSYLSSRSVLTASPIDLSFISRGSDLDSSVEEHRILQSVENNLSESLLFCLNGGQPSSLDDDSVENSRFAADKLCAVQVATSVPVKDVGTESSTFCKNFLQETSL
ncbi:rho GTPase-activating protein 19 isoform X2 [Schistocerca serialis cubense]|uniref:rho GTPase-activating protein 19 isoform X2 n=1 Tax=Schistocerca serialis cubense TaxID=2023355 RepID=UPI00214F5696|nr:rho GTPase-activating protein 19 isoform X2 [Schistocerca serialis cubense]